MRIPHVYRIGDEDPAGSAEVEVDISPESYLEDLGLFEDKKEYVKWILRMKKMIRDSFEYTEAIYFMKRKTGMNCCGVHPNLTIDSGFRIELHHTPFTLEDILHTVVNRRLQEKESLKMTDIGREILELHYLKLVGLYPLCELCHHFAHSDSGDELFIPIGDVRGNPAEFARLYGKYMPDPLRVKWENVQQLNRGYELIAEHIPPGLRKKYIYVKPKDKAGRESDLEVISTNKLVDLITELSKPML